MRRARCALRKRRQSSGCSVFVVALSLDLAVTFVQGGNSNWLDELLVGETRPTWPSGGKANKRELRSCFTIGGLSVGDTNLRRWLSVCFPSLFGLAS